MFALLLVVLPSNDITGKGSYSPHCISSVLIGAEVSKHLFSHRIRTPSLCDMQKINAAIWDRYLERGEKNENSVACGRIFCTPPLHFTRAGSNPRPEGPRVRDSGFWQIRWKFIFFGPERLKKVPDFQVILWLQSTQLYSPSFRTTIWLLRGRRGRGGERGGQAPAGSVCSQPKSVTDMFAKICILLSSLALFFWERQERNTNTIFISCSIIFIFSALPPHASR